jgi:putative tryptophan/tyrosine transport system substrate-binding protein
MEADRTSPADGCRGRPAGGRSPRHQRHREVVSELRKRTRTIPIVFVQVPDPVELGLVVSLARPGGNDTGFTHFELAMGEKWLEALKEISPHVRRVALLQNPDHPAWPGFLRTIKAAAPSFGVEVFPTGIHEAGDIVGDRSLRA